MPTLAQSQVYDLFKFRVREMKGSAVKDLKIFDTITFFTYVSRCLLVVAPSVFSRDYSMLPKTAILPGK